MSRIRANKITNQLADGSPTVEKGLIISGVTTSTTFSGSGASLTNLNASNIASGTVPTARLGSGTASSSTFLRGDSTFQTVNTDLVSDTSPQLGANLDTNTKCIDFGDSNTGTVNRLRFGASTDLEIFHNGTNNHIDCHTAGQDLYIRPTKDVYIQDYSTDDIHIKMIKDGAVELYNNDSKKLETTNTGAVVTGILTATAFVPTSQGALSHRNLLINGAMQVNERGNTAYNPVTSSIYTLDRWRAFSGSSFDRDSGYISQSTQSPPGFSNSIKQDIGNTETPSANQNAGFEQKIEGNNLQSLAYGTSSAKTTTLSFWVYSNKLGTYCVQLMQEDGTKYVLYEYTISASNTWEHKTINIVGNTANAINNDNTIGLRVLWHLCCGSSDHVAATSTWTSGSSFHATSNQVNLWDHADNYWYMTGCQLEIGTVSTPFEHRRFSEELMMCKRYYQRSTDSSRGTDYSLSTGTWHSADGVQSFSKHNNYYDFKQNFEIEMRAAPTLTIYGSTNQGDIHIESVAVASKQVDWNNNTTEVKTKGFLLRHIEDQSDGNYTSGSGNAFGILAYTLDAEL